MFDQLIARLTHWLSRDEPTNPAQPWFNPDSNWHSSSFELACGLQVIEHAAPPAGFADGLRIGLQSGA